MKYSFTYFRSKEAYIKLKATLALQDHKERYFPISNEEIDYNASILVTTFDALGENENYLELTLLDILMEYIEDTAKRYSKWFVRKIENSSTFTVENVNHFANVNLSKVSELLDLIYSFNFLEEEIKTHLDIHLNSLKHLYGLYSKNAYPDIKRKLNWNLNRQTITYFFYRLRYNNIIEEDTSDADLSRIIQNMICYMNENGEYKEIGSVRGLLSDYNGGDGSKSTINPAETLEKIFQEEQFFI